MGPKIHVKELALETEGGEEEELRLPRHQKGERFIKGPIPFRWFSAASSLPGKALHVAMVAWHQAGIVDAPKVKLSHKLLRKAGVNRYAVYRALDALEEAGLVAVERHPGRSPIVTLLELETE